MPISGAPRSALLAALFAGLVAMPGSAEIYQWTDASGRLHFTHHLDHVPPAHREQAVRNAREEAEAPAPSGPERSASTPLEIRRAQRLGAEVEIPFVAQGTLMRVEATVNGLVDVPFLIDTGASGVSLPSRFADRLGIRVRGDTPYQEIHTANGVIARPLVTLDSVELGGVRVEKLEATINPSMNVGLLGGTFFNNFIYSVDAARGVITLSPNDKVRAGLGPEQWRQRFELLRDPLRRLDEYLEENPRLDDDEREFLEKRREQLEADLHQLELEANKLGVPQVWRYGAAASRRSSR